MESEIIFLLAVGFLAGLMDAAVGGGGLLQIPGLFSLMPSATPVATVMGVNKFASCSGTAMAGFQFIRKIRVPWKMLLPAALLAFLFSYLGAQLVSWVPVKYMKPAMLVIMVGMFVYTFFKKSLVQTLREQALSKREYYLGLFSGAMIGLYDGIFGPGTGSFLTFIFVRFFAFDFMTATASAKVINITTNLAALSYFVPNGYIIWAWALPLAAANLIGSVAGAHLAIRGGTRFLRYGFMVLLVILIGKFGWDVFRG